MHADPKGAFETLEEKIAAPGYSKAQFDPYNGKKKTV